MTQFIKLRSIIFNKSDIKQVSQSEIDKNKKFTLTIITHSGNNWDMNNMDYWEYKTFENNLLIDNAAEKLKEIKSYVKYKRGRKSAADDHIMNIIES